MFKRAAVTVGATAAALAVTATLATPASAAGNEHYHVGTPGAAGHFYSNGDEFGLFDARPDNRGVTLIVDVRSGFVWKPLAVRYNGRGFGKTTTYSFDITEGRGVRFKVCKQKSVGAPVEDCSVWRQATA